MGLGLQSVQKKASEILYGGEIDPQLITIVDSNDRGAMVEIEDMRRRVAEQGSPERQSPTAFFVCETDLPGIGNN